MTSIDPRIATGRLTIDLSALVANWRFMAQKSGAAKTAAVVKANAYGLGLEPVARALADAGCDRFFVAVPDEAVRLRRAVTRVEIFVLSGAFDEQAAAVMAEAHAIPVLNSLQQIAIWADFWKARGGRKPCAIHVDTGMNRLGLTPAEAIAFGEENARSHALTPILLMSHLACADDVDHPLNRQQLESFQAVQSVFSDIESSFCNSAGILLGPDYHFDLTRPGIALYGGAAVNDVPNIFAQVVTAEARILQIRHAKAGETVSYGATQTLTRDTVIAVAGCGYADGFQRAGSGAGVALREGVTPGAFGFVAGQKVPVLGRITMDLTLFDITDVAPAEQVEGGWIELFGPNIHLDDAARTAGTVAYELLTSLGSRYHRRYRDSQKAV